MTGNPIQGRPCLLPTQVCVLSYRSTSFQRQDSTATAVRDRSLCVPSSHDGDTHRTSGFLGGWGRTAFRPWSPVTRATASSPVRSQEIRVTCVLRAFFKVPPGSTHTHKHSSGNSAFGTTEVLAMVSIQ